MPDKLDNIDFKILKIIQENGNTTNLDLSKNTGLSAASTFERVKKLEQKGAIKGYHAVVNPGALGLNIEAIIEIALTHQVKNSIDRFKEAADEMPEITECYQVTGNVDFVVKAIVKDIPAYEYFITKKLGKLEIISNMRTRVILATTKKTHLLPADYENAKLYRSV